MRAPEHPVKKKVPSPLYALAVMLGTMAIILVGSVLLDAPLQAMFLLSWLFVYPACMVLGYSFRELEEGALNAIREGLGPVLIVLTVGGMIASWTSAGTIATIIYGGLGLISPVLFLPAAFWITSGVSLACGTSWGTLGTAGIAIFAIGESLGIPSAMTVGAVVSGCFLGDMTSPMSASPNTACGVCGAELTAHLRELSFITVPAFILSSLFYGLLGLGFRGSGFDTAVINGLKEELAGQFAIGYLPLVPLLLLFALLLGRRPPVLSMLASSVAAMVVTAAVQGGDIREVLPTFWQGHSAHTGSAFLDTLLNRGGVASMAETATLLIFAFGLLGVMRTAGITEAVVRPLAGRIGTLGQLTAVSQLLVIFGNMLGTNQFSMLMTGSVMLPVYRRFRLHPTNLSRLLNATSTGFCALIPWNASSIYVAGLFGVSALDFAPYAAFAYLTVLVTAVMGILKLRTIPAEPQ